MEANKSIVSDPPEVHNLSELLRTLEGASDGDGSVSVADIRDHLGPRSFGPFLLAAGLIGSTPASGIPAFPTIISITVLLTAGQMVLGWKRVWLPGALLNRSISRARLRRAIGFLRRPVGAIDRFIRPRLTFLTHAPFSQILGICCCLIALIKPPLELVPATSAIPAAVIAIFGLALTAHDGLLALIGLIAFVALAVAVVVLGGALIS